MRRRGGAASGSATRRRVARRLGELLILVGIGAIVWAGVVWKWNDPVTSVYTRWKQHELGETYREVVRSAPVLRSERPTPPDEAGAMGRERGAASAGPSGHRGADRPDPGATAGPRHVRRERHDDSRSQAGARSGSANVHAGPERARLHRRPSDDVSSAVREDRGTAGRRPRGAGDALRAIRVPGHRPQDRRLPTTSRCFAPTIERCSRSRHATRGSSRPTGTSSGRSP